MKLGPVTKIDKRNKIFFTIFLPENADFFAKKADISKIKGTLVLKGIFLKLHIWVYLRATFEVSTIF